MIGGEKNMTRRMANHPFNENGMVSRWEGCDAGRYGDWEWETGGVKGVVIQLSTGSHKGMCAVVSGDGWITPLLGDPRPPSRADDRQRQ